MTERHGPDDPVSTVRGRWQGPGLSAVVLVVLVTGIGALLLPRGLGEATAVVTVGLVVGAPLARVAWLTGRFASERDWRFAAVSLGVLGVVALGALLAATGVGG